MNMQVLYLHKKNITEALFVLALENANNKKRANKINLNILMLQNIDRLSSGDDAADIFLL